MHVDEATGSTSIYRPHPDRGEHLPEFLRAQLQGLTLVQVRAQLEQLQDTFMS